MLVFEDESDVVDEVGEMPGDVEEKQGRLQLAPLPSVLEDVLSPAQVLLLQHRTLQSIISILPVGASLCWCVL